MASPDGVLHGFVDDATAALGVTRKVVSVVPCFPTALSVALASDLIAMVPALYLRNQRMTENLHVFELPFKTRNIVVSQMWHPEWKRIPGWLRENFRGVSGTVTYYVPYQLSKLHCYHGSFKAHGTVFGTRC